MPAVINAYSREELDLIKKTVAAGTSDLEFQLFVTIAQTTGLSPLHRQIYAIMRNEKQQDGSYKKRMTIQTGIDGYRLIASRTRQLAGIDDADYDTEDAPHPKWARVTVWRMVGGQRCPFTAKARWDEYVQTNKDGKSQGLWAKMPYLMLAKVAEALALRKAFPAELSSVYTHQEMAQANGPDQPVWATAEQITALKKACTMLGYPPISDDEYAEMTAEEAAETLARYRREWESRQTAQEEIGVTA